MNNSEIQAFEIAKQITIETIKNPANKEVCCKMNANNVVDYFNTIYDGILKKLHNIDEKE